MRNLLVRKTVGLLALAFILPMDATASERRLDLSPSFAVKWPSNLEISPLYTPSFEAFVLDGKSAGVPFRGQIRRVRGRLLATPSGVAAEWKNNLKSLGKLEKNGTDLGCKKVGSGVFTCERQGRSPSGEFINDRLIFNRAHEVVHLRITAKSSAAQTTAIAHGLEIEAK